MDIVTSADLEISVVLVVMHKHVIFQVHIISGQILPSVLMVVLVLVIVILVFQALANV